ATFCYAGPQFPGADSITAFADMDNNAVQGPGEPSGTATKTWILPVSTALCDISILDGGWITAANGDKAMFLGFANFNGGKTRVWQEYHDYGPARRMHVRSIGQQVTVCEGSDQATIYGKATIDGTGSFQYRIHVIDLCKLRNGR